MLIPLEKRQQLFSLHTSAPRDICRQVNTFVIRCQQVAVNIVNAFDGGVFINARDDVLVGIFDVHIWRSIGLITWHSAVTALCH